MASLPRRSVPARPTTSTEAADPYVGRVVAGRFRVESLLGVGGMGRVYKALHLGLDRLVCLKMLRPQLAEDPSIIGRFEREAKAASRLNHPHSIQVLDFGQDEEGSLFIVMEYVAGRDLRKLLHDEFPLPEERICDIVAQVLSALAEAHASQVVHRDLKPENIMVEVRRDAPDYVKVLDFGIAKIQDPDVPGLTRADVVCGTPLYMSPEQATGAAFDGRADLYAVGVILYQLTTNTLPFEGANSMEILTKHVRDLPVPPRVRRPGVAVSPELETLILRALEKDPAKRPQTADEFRKELLVLGERAKRARESAEEAAQEASTQFRLKQEAELAAHQASQRAAQATVADRPAAIEVANAKSKAPIAIAAGVALLALGAAAWAFLGTSEMVAPPDSSAPLPSTMARADSPAPAPSTAVPSDVRPDDGATEKGQVDSARARPARIEVKAEPAPATVVSKAVAPKPAEPKPAVKAPEATRRITQADRDRAIGFSDEGDLLFEEESYAQAIGAYRKAIGADPELARAYRGLFRAGHATGDRAAARTGANGYLKLVPHAPDAAVIKRQLDDL